jgi:hypothetical protein
MPTIAEVRQKFPQYSDLSDDQLASALHKKFYADMPEEQFKTKIGMPAKKSQPVQRADLGGFVGRQVNQMVAPVQRDVAEDLAFQKQAASMPFAEQMARSVTDPFAPGGALRTAQYLYDIYAGATLPVTKAVRKISDPIEQATRFGGKKGIDVGEALAALGPEAGALGAAGKAAGVTEETAAASNALSRVTGRVMGATDDAKHLAAVKRLKEAGIELTPGHELGGEARRTEQAYKSNRMVGGAIRKRETRAIESVNEAAYKKTLEAAAEKYDPSMKAGRDGLAAVEEKLSAKYDRVLNREVNGKPKVRFVADEEFANRVAGIEKTLARAKPGTRDQFKEIYDQLVAERFQDNGFKGRAFKDIETDLRNESNINHRSQDPNDQRLASAVDDLIGALQDGMERHSDPGVRDELKQANTGWAMFSRLRAAANRRATSGGVFSAGDLLQTVKMGDKSAKKSAFMRGDALMQDFAEDAYRVLKNDLPDSGTPERLDRMGVLGAGLGGAIGGIPGAAVGYVAERAGGAGTNALAEYFMKKRAQEQAMGVKPSAPGMLNGLRNVTPYALQAGQIAAPAQMMQNQQ